MTNGQVNLQVFVVQTDIYGINVKSHRVKEWDTHISINEELLVERYYYREQS